MLYHSRACKEGRQVTGRVEGKVALIVGAGCVGPGWGNGRAAAVLFAREGAKVFAVDKNADSMTETLERVGNDGEIATHVCDVLDDAQVAAMTEACRKRFGRIDILVNNVGGSAAGGVAEMSEDNFDRQIDYNLKSVFLTCRHIIPVMVAQGGGAIVNDGTIEAVADFTLGAQDLAASSPIAGTGKHQIVAAAFGQRRQPAAQKPGQWMKPIDCSIALRPQQHPMIAALDMRPLVGQDRRQQII